ncbi:adenosylmethionine decarboxylase [Garciella nitratireducens]|uniref:S-adenosylmethionine decarboxylase proenzyme n=1 Tax=Garciella nitratireducens DSM 15102 TaxID=1121911 RepID=A0A1T4KRE1_9FIRM|nr:adenosylmethionine decarboxylase [Garciella nitratireducens]SJZ44930.1 adenosylmethionine decarboxylase proenzyme [Garciella nitratireducens DSM 15102]
MQTYSRHCILELWDCNINLLNDRNLIEKLMVEAALEAGAEIREIAFHKFAPQGISGVVVISESHLSIHTFPEQGYASIDVFTCGKRINPHTAAYLIAKKLEAQKIYEMNLERGIGEIKIVKNLNPITKTI